MSTGPRVAVVVPVYNKLPLTIRFLDSFREVVYPHHHIIVVDDGSQDGTSAVLANAYPQITVLRGNGNLWWAGANNLAIRHVLERDFQYVLTINNDTRVAPRFLTYLVETAEHNPRCIVGSRINFIDQPTHVWAIGSSMQWSRGELFQLSGYGEAEGTVLAERSNPCPVEILTGCGTLVPVRCYHEVGLYDARDCPQYHADSEFVLRAARRGYRALVDLRAVVFNDARNTCAVGINRYYDFLFSRRSAVYWRPIVSIHMRYCPWYLLVTSLIQHYARFFWFNDPRAQRLRRVVKRLFGRSQPSGGAEEMLGTREKRNEHGLAA
jgi:GT2 family glycosyltransferase